MAHPTEALYDPRRDDPALTVSDVELTAETTPPERTNYFSVYLVRTGAGHVWADAACHPFAAPALLFFVPYQNVRFLPAGPLRGVRVQFHANFLCIETYHEEVGCNGILFNDVYGVPVVGLDDRQAGEFDELIGHVRRELADGGLAHSELVLSYLKVLLIRATRLKREQTGGTAGPAGGRLPPELDTLRDLIEQHFRHEHAPADYARRLHTDARTLGKLVKTHLHKTLTELIRERVIRQAKWDLLHTLKPVKQIARELGYADELYFSRVFKRATGYAPVFFREYETAIRGGRNLSIPSPLPSIPPPAGPADTEYKPV